MKESPEAFLSAVAKAYFENEADNLLDYCFVFPNKRSATFFTDFMATEMRQHGSNRLIHPECETIVDFLDSFVDSAQADRMEMIFILYNTYLKAIAKHSAKEHAIDFNKFVYWADVLLTDFEDVDAALADPAEIFHNVESLKEISSNYLTPDQIKVLQQYWKDEKLPEPAAEFWNHISYPTDAKDGKTSVSVSFLKLWQVMFDVYTGFQNALREKHLHTTGMAYRAAVKTLKDCSHSDLPYNRYIFIGFNNLSVAEKKIFDYLRDMRNSANESMADFYWDVASPVVRDTRFDVARMMLKHQQTYPSRYNCVQPVDGFPEIEIIGVPSRVGQTKVIGQLLNHLFPADAPEIDKHELRRTAVVLPEEGTLTPLLNALPDHIDPLNITMGYKLRNTSVAGLVKNIVSMQMRAYKTSKCCSYFRDDVLNVLSHPLVRSFDHNECTRLISEIEMARLFNVPESLLVTDERPGFRPVFTMIANKRNSKDVFDYLLNLMKWLSEALKTWIPEQPATEDEDNNGEQDDYQPATGEETTVIADKNVARSVALQEAFIRRYTAALIKLQNFLNTYLGERHTFVEDATIFNLIERIVQGEMLNFEGVPLKGLQIMGVLEARALDFNTLILLSVNERVFPRIKSNTSFIPKLLRSAYGLSTTEDQENAYAYFFYRMISRVKKVYLLYDARTSGLKSSQVSRYIHQLIYLFKPEGLKHKIIPYQLISPELPNFTINKTDEMMAIINRYRADGPNTDEPKYLSASSIKQYLGCPMAFYFEKIKGYRREDSVSDWMDEGTYGTIVHEVFEHLYGSRLENSANGVRITSHDIDEIINHPAEIDRLILTSINKNYYNKGDNCTEALNGDAAIIAEIIREFVAKTLEREKPMTPFTYLHGEWNHSGPLTIKGSEEDMHINFTCKIDRIDMIEDADNNFNRLRIIDYKTGSDKLEAGSRAEIFDKHELKAFLQVMLYCEAYAQTEGYHDSIQPMVFQLRTMMLNKIEPLKLWAPQDIENVEHENLKLTSGSKKWKLLDYLDYTTEVNDELISRLKGLFDKDTPFTCAEREDECTLCTFAAICQRNIKK